MEDFEYDGNQEEAEGGHGQDHFPQGETARFGFQRSMQFYNSNDGSHGFGKGNGRFGFDGGQSGNWEGMGQHQEEGVEIMTWPMSLESPFYSMRRREADITGSVLKILLIL